MKGIAVGLLADSADLFWGDTTFVAAMDQLESKVSNPWTVREAFTVGAGCHRKAGAFAYWQHRELAVAINAAWDRVGDVVSTEHPEWWANQKGRSQSEVVEALDAAAEAGDVDPPAEVTKRAWCHTAKVRTCRVPFVPLAAMVHAWKLEPGPLGDLLARYGVDAATDPWSLLDRVEPEIADTEAPDGVGDTADVLRRWMGAQEPEVLSPAELLANAADASSDIKCDELVELALADIARVEQS